jgi:hypothetical protein
MPVSLVQHASNSGHAVTSLSATLGSDVTAGNAVICTVSVWSSVGGSDGLHATSSGTTGTFSYSSLNFLSMSSSSNLYPAGTGQNAGGDIGWCLVTSGGTAGYTFNFNIDANVVIDVFEFSGVSANTYGFSGDFVTGLAFVAVTGSENINAGDLAIGCHCMDNTSATTLSSSSFNNYTATVSTYTESIASYFISATSASLTYNVTYNQDISSQANQGWPPMLFFAQAGAGIAVPVATVNIAANTVTASSAKLVVPAAQIAINVYPVTTSGDISPLIVSVAARAGTDSYGNAYPAGFYTTVPVQVEGGSNDYEHGEIAGSPRQLEITSPMSGSSDSQASVTLDSAASPGSGSVTVSPAETVDGPLTATGAVIAQAGITVSADGIAVTGGTVTDTLTASGAVTAEDDILLQESGGVYSSLVPAATVPKLTCAASGAAAGFAGSLPVAMLADFTAVTVTAASFTTITKTWTIPANDAAVGSVYKLTVFATATQGSTAQGGLFALVFGSNSAGCHFPSGIQATSDTLQMMYEGYAVCVTTGGTGTWWLFGRANLGVADAGTCGGATAVVTQSTTSSISVSAEFEWSATTGAPTMTSRLSFFQRVA